MRSSFKTGILLLTGALLGMALLALLGARPTVAQESATLRALIERREARGGSIIIQFAEPVVAGETLLMLPDETAGRALSEIGNDYMCFSEPWNDTRRQHCVPFANIISLSYIED